MLDEEKREYEYDDGHLEKIFAGCLAVCGLVLFAIVVLFFLNIDSVLEWTWSQTPVE